MIPIAGPAQKITQVVRSDSSVALRYAPSAGRGQLATLARGLPVVGLVASGVLLAGPVQLTRHRVVRRSQVRQRQRQRTPLRPLTKVRIEPLPWQKTQTDPKDAVLDMLPSTRRLLTEAESITVVDCGSGSTRAISFKEDGGQLSWEKSSWRGDPLASALQDELRLESLLCLLGRQVPKGRLLLGATAGVRDAVEKGVISASHLRFFEDRLQHRLGKRASFTMLSGEQEGQAEWEAVQHQLARPEECAGMLSGGGMSCQLVARRAEPLEEPQFFSFPNEVLTPNGIVDRAAAGSLTLSEAVTALTDLEGRLLKQFSTLPTGLSGCFSLAEWVGFYVGGEPTARDLALGLGYERPFRRNHLIEAVDQQLTFAKQNYAAADSKEARRLAVSLVYGTVLRTLLHKVFAKEASFSCIRNVNWAAGHYLMSRKADQN